MLKLSQFRDGVRQIPRVFALVWRASAVGTVLLALLTLASALTPLGVAWAGKKIVDAVVAHDTAGAMRWVALELVLVAVQALGNRGAQLVRQLLGGRLVIDIHMLILEKAQQLELKHFENHDFYDKLMRARSEASYRPVSLLGQALGIVQNTITLIGYAAMLVAFSPLAVAGMVIAAVPATVVEMVYAGKAYRITSWRSPERRRLNYVEYVLANDGHVKEVKVGSPGTELEFAL